MMTGMIEIFIALVFALAGIYLGIVLMTEAKPNKKQIKSLPVYIIGLLVVGVNSYLLGLIWTLA